MSARALPRSGGAGMRAIRISFFMPAELLLRYRRTARELGVKLAELIREALREWPGINNKEKDDD